MLSAKEQIIYNVLKAQTSSVDVETSLIAVAKMLASLSSDSLTVAGQIIGESFFVPISPTAITFSDFSVITELSNITITLAPEKFIIPATGWYSVSYFATISANQNSIIRFYPTINGSFLNGDDNYKVSAETFSGHIDGTLTFGKTVLMQLNQNDQIGLGCNGSNGALLGIILNINKI